MAYTKSPAKLSLLNPALRGGKKKLKSVPTKATATDRASVMLAGATKRKKTTPMANPYKGKKTTIGLTAAQIKSQSHDYRQLKQKPTSPVRRAKPTKKGVSSGIGLGVVKPVRRAKPTTKRGGGLLGKMFKSVGKRVHKRVNVAAKSAKNIGGAVAELRRGASKAVGNVVRKTVSVAAKSAGSKIRGAASAGRSVKKAVRRGIGGFLRRGRRK
jgi:hypothetical protein